MKKVYETPTAQRLDFDYAKVVTSSGSTQPDGGGNNGRWSNGEYDRILGLVCWWRYINH